MPTYVGLLSWTDQGVKSVKETVERAQAAADQLEEMGGRFREIVWTSGIYDIVAIMDAPDEETMAAFVLRTGAAGNVRSVTMRGFDRDEMSRVLEKLG